MGKISSGINAQVGKSTMYKSRRPNRRRMKKSMNFNRRVEKALQATLKESNTLIENYSFRLEAGGFGSQNHASICNILTHGDLTNIWNKIGTLFNQVQGSNSVAQKFCIDSYHVELMLKNQGQTATIVDVYDIVPRNDTILSPVAAFATGMTDQNASTAYNPLDQKWGVTPFQSHLFTTTYKVLNKTRYLLSPGAIEIINVRDSRCRVVDYERIARLGSNNSQMYRGISRSLYVVIRGEPINDATTKTNVSTSSCAVDFISNETYNYSWSPQAMSKIDVVGLYGTVSTANSLLPSTGTVGAPTYA